MKRTVVINNVEYEVPEINFNALCDLADYGVDILNPKQMKKSTINSARAIVAWITDSDVEAAGELIQAHMIAGNGITEIFDAFTQAVEDSDFFKALKNQEGRKPVQPQDHKRKMTTKA